MENASNAYERLLQENKRLREQVSDLESQISDDASSQKDSKQPIQGMLKLLKSKNDQIEDSVAQLQEANAKLQDEAELTVRYYKSTITALSSAMEAKDPYFQFHSSNVESICRKIAHQMSLEKKDVDILSSGAHIHDFGNIGIRSSVILKEGALTPEEYEHVKTHPMIASIILEPIGDFEIIIDSIKSHHENFDGSGYPEGLQGQDIHFFARIIYIAECYDAITQPRPYRTPLGSVQEALQEIGNHAGTRYDPEIVTALQQVLG